MCFALDMRYTRDMLPYGNENGIYIISRLPQGKHIEFYVVKYIELRSNISRITILNNSMYSLSDSEKGSTKFVLPFLILSYTVTSRENVRHIFYTLGEPKTLCK